MNNTLTDVPGIRVGHAQDLDALTGCTVILCPPNTIGGVDQRGGAPGTRETDLLHPMHLIQHVDAILLAGGSAFGLAAADGVMRFLEERKVGFKTFVATVPIVPAAILFDLDLGRADRRPTNEMGYAACENASAHPVEQGCFGAGTGARIGSFMGVSHATKGGIGSASIALSDGLVISALVAVNAVGDVIDERGEIMAGARTTPDGQAFVNMLNMLRGGIGIARPSQNNTVIGVVATNAKLTKEETNKLAQMGQDGLAQAIRPAHTLFDGDTLFALSTGEVETNFFAVSAFAAEVVAMAIRNGVKAAVTMGGIPAHGDIIKNL